MEIAPGFLDEDVVYIEQPEVRENGLLEEDPYFS